MPNNKSVVLPYRAWTLNGRPAGVMTTSNAGNSREASSRSPPPPPRRSSTHASERAAPANCHVRREQKTRSSIDSITTDSLATTSQSCDYWRSAPRNQRAHEIHLHNAGPAELNHALPCWRAAWPGPVAAATAPPVVADAEALGRRRLFHSHRPRKEVAVSSEIKRSTLPSHANF